MHDHVSLPSLGPVATCGGMLVSGRAMALSEFTGEVIAESKAERAERREVMRDIRALFHAERRARRHLAIRASVDRIVRNVPRARTSHRVGTSKPTTSGSSDDDGQGPPRRYERVLVATVRPDGSPCEAVVEIDPLHIDPTALVFAARRAAGHSLASATAGLDDVQWRAIHRYAKGGVA